MITVTEVFNPFTYEKELLTYVAPIPNLNGADKDSLYRQQAEVIAAIDALSTALRNAAPHGRDFQLQTRGEFKTAQDVHYMEVMELVRMRFRHTCIRQAIHES